MVLVTRANTGMGFQAALKYAQLRASTLILVVRSVEKGETAKGNILRHVTSPVTIIIKILDLSTFASVKTFAQDIIKHVSELHVVQLCAGIMSTSFNLGAEGYESASQVNVLSTALLALLLFLKVQETAAAASDDSYMPHISFLNSMATQDVLEE
ncbi:hypothetical protein F5Y19DRAFT_446369 [Xylariaceae sp. FL1651]|nr:hypothetical protein F5Y19DRAFT_446369 [Xylariaceae sp. FL1651]